ncbi:hypothetical protein GYMLUDRAFT_251365 [Collybiopsis luxurians FD-317 M1]|uniref:Uncharacterized protein n=1 Tax=Collybiopsis luxurians FD-317 M1 TaxID=944289 RepID=A0A0D0C2Z3_9AGAR|nr:hypothetical protein GYMLUDRAFT_251365 [Collybiopsis luxurians FD-317 M1]
MAHATECEDLKAQIGTLSQELKEREAETKALKDAGSTECEDLRAQISSLLQKLEGSEAEIKALKSSGTMQDARSPAEGADGPAASDLLQELNTATTEACTALNSIMTDLQTRVKRGLVSQEQCEASKLKAMKDLYDAKEQELLTKYNKLQDAVKVLMKISSHL